MVSLWTRVRSKPPIGPNPLLPSFKACYWVSNKAGLLARDILADRLAQNVDNFRTSVNDQRLRHFVKERKKRSHSYSSQTELL